MGENALRVMMVASGKYDIPGKKLKVITGYGAYGKPVTKEIPAIDKERLERDLQDMLFED